jgi:uncharacterized protein YutE (UPF0331/DUF86 family)
MDNQTVLTIVILLLISLLFLIAYINSKKIPQRKKERILEKLDELKFQIKSSDQYARRDAIIKLDNLLNKAFNLRYSNSDGCGSNLKKAKGLFDKKKYQQLWEVHKLRNKIVHNDMEIDLEEARQAYNIYKMGIRKTLQ